MDERTTDGTADRAVSGAADTWPLSAREAAAALGVSERTVRRAIARGDLPAALHAGVYQIAPADLARYRSGQSAPLRLIPLPERRAADAAALPRPFTSLVGREGEVAALSALVRREDVRLVTLTGPGGVGKTRLALRVAEEVTGDFPDGVWFVPLAPVEDPTLVVAAVAGALGVRKGGGRPFLTGLQAFLRDRRSLLVLDNFEHVAVAAPAVTDLLAVCSCLAVLVTSRAALRLSGEHGFAVPPLALPDLDLLPEPDGLIAAPAVRLFVERARVARADFALTPHNGGAVAAICARLDGLPLAIELAAARSTVLPPAALLARLEPRLPLLTGGPRDAPARLRTMRAAIAWSHDLLTADDRALFRRLAVFVGGFTLEAAEAVCETEETGNEEQGTDDRLSPGLSVHSVLDGIASLIDQSLLRPLAPPVDAPATTPPRFGMLETVREFALDMLAASGDAERTRRRHAAYFLDLAKQCERHLTGAGDTLQWLALLDAELPNVRAALAWLDATGEATRAAEMTFALWRFWFVRDHFAEGTTWIARVLDHGDRAPAPLRAKLLGERGLFELLQTPDRALTTLDEAVALALASRDAEAIGWSHWIRGTAKMHRGDLAGATADADVSTAAYTELGHRWYAGGGRWILGWVRKIAGDIRGAEAVFTQLIAIGRTMEDYYSVGEFSVGLGHMALDRHDDDLALVHLGEALRCGRLVDADHLVADAGEGLAVVLAHRGDAERAARLFGAMDVLRLRSGAVRTPVRVANVDPAIASLRDRLGPAAMDTAWQAGRTMPLADALAEVAAAVTRRTDARPGDPLLTRREMEVLRLLAEGRTDPEIAAALFVSRRTAATHVAAVFRKLGVTSRAAAAAYAVRHGLA